MPPKRGGGPHPQARVGAVPPLWTIALKARLLARRRPRRASAEACVERSGRRRPPCAANGAKGPVRRQLSEKGVEKRLFSKDRSAEIDRRVILFLSARCTVKNYRTVRTDRNGCRQADQAVGCLHLICVKPYINSINFSRSSASEAARETAYFRFLKNKSQSFPNTLCPEAPLFPCVWRRPPFCPCRITAQGTVRYRRGRPTRC